MIDNKTAIELFEEIRSMPISHKSDKYSRACDARAHKIAELLRDRGADNVRKAWIYSLPVEGDKSCENIRIPVDISDPVSDEDYDENGMPNDPDPDLPKPYNIHVAPVVRTSEGRELVFDTFFYSKPPLLDQWIEDFPPFEEGSELGFKKTDISYLYFHETDEPLPKEGSLSRKWYDMKRRALASFELEFITPRELEKPLNANWLSDNFALNDDSGLEPPKSDI